MYCIFPDGIKNTTLSQSEQKLDLFGPSSVHVPFNGFMAMLRRCPKEFQLRKDLYCNLPRGLRVEITLSNHEQMLYAAQCTREPKLLISVFDKVHKLKASNI